mgnify:CR=1 FL=1
MFQSLSRDSGRLNRRQQVGRRALVEVSIPQSGFGAFELGRARMLGRDPSDVSIPQSGFGAFERVPGKSSVSRRKDVSIPQSGFGAFELGLVWICATHKGWFQSLSRDSGRLNSAAFGVSAPLRWRFNPSVGIRGV